MKIPPQAPTQKEQGTLREVGTVPAPDSGAVVQSSVHGERQDTGKLDFDLRSCQALLTVSYDYTATHILLYFLHCFFLFFFLFNYVIY